MDNRCNGDTCKVLKYQSTEEAMKCTKQPTVKEDVDTCKLLPLALQRYCELISLIILRDLESPRRGHAHVNF